MVKWLINIVADEEEAVFYEKTNQILTTRIISIDNVNKLRVNIFHVKICLEFKFEKLHHSPYHFIQTSSILLIAAI